MTDRLRIVAADPLGPDALALLREAAEEMRVLYERDASAPWPTNEPLPSRGAYLIAYRGDAAGMAALHPLDDATAEVRRMFVRRRFRRLGIARAILRALEAQAWRLGYRRLRLETGARQAPAIAFYTALGYARIAPFGCHVEDADSLCFEKVLAEAREVTVP